VRGVEVRENKLPFGPDRKAVRVLSNLSKVTIQPPQTVASTIFTFIYNNLFC